MCLPKKKKEKKEINLMGPFDWKGEKNKRIKNEKGIDKWEDRRNVVLLY